MRKYKEPIMQLRDVARIATSGSFLSGIGIDSQINLNLRSHIKMPY